MPFATQMWGDGPWTYRGGEWAGCEEKGEEVPSQQLDLKGQLFYFFFFPFLSITKRTPCKGGWMWSWISPFRDRFVWCCSPFLPETDKVPSNLHCSWHIIYNTFFWRISENFILMIIEKCTGSTDILASVVRSPSQPTESESRCVWGSELTVRSEESVQSPCPLADSSAKQCCVTQLRRLLIAKRGLCSLFSVQPGSSLRCYSFITVRLSQNLRDRGSDAFVKPYISRQSEQTHNPDQIML